MFDYVHRANIVSYDVTPALNLSFCYATALPYRIDSRDELGKVEPVGLHACQVVLYKYLRSSPKQGLEH